MSNTREAMPILAMLQEASELVRDAAVAKSIRVIVVGVADEVLISRADVVLVVASLLREAIAAAPPGGRVAVTGQEIERELVCSVYGAGANNAPSEHADVRAIATARALGGRVWSGDPADGHLNLFSLPLYRDAN